MIQKGPLVQTATIPGNQVRYLDSSDWERIRRVFNGTEQQEPEQSVTTHPSVIPSGAISLTHLAPTAIEQRLADLQQQIDDLTARINSMAANTECQP